MKRITTFIIGLLIGGAIIGAAGITVYYSYVRPRHVAEVKRETEKDAADRSSLALRVSDLNKDLQAASKKLPAQPGQSSVNKLSSTAEAQLVKRLNSEQFIGTVLMVRNGTIIYHQGFGYADASKKRLNTVKSIFQIGSTQKSLTAIALAQLIAQGKVHYSDNIHQYYSQIPSSHNITIRQMLDMRSGLIYTLGAPKAVLTDAQVVQRNLDNLVYDAAFHGKQNYQAVNFVLLAGIIEKVSGQSYEQYITQHLFQPLNFTNAQVGFAWNFAKQANRTVSYVAKDGIGTYGETITEKLADMRGELGTGNIYTTPYALYQLERAINQGKYISTDDLDTLRDTTDGQYGGGVYNFPDYVYSHGVKNYQDLVFAMSKDGNTAIVLMSNRPYEYNKALDKAKWYYNFAQTAELSD
ncbi:serine hydrolase [Schleiferilactobacillus harbinensis]|uniref:Beta-lactamase class C-like penicillin binding protein n=1 Tax=Schleiferilactobacillus harbinensis DSM 16991 TaxID=1122147 RepID=A0A0R1XD06_9LACO|nr:serine hydrolase domain-containing protein [Schleiferilactobacillus harbinensis]KRM27541.1 beta-lactamase class C-like penicillin binding protein [Schleiferilactobacillus harbinensis DSM 16991]QFR62699.1 serine hydrolase [Schleiferilactobacillus harbinensis]